MENSLRGSFFTFNSLNVTFKNVLKEKVLPSMALSENVNHLVHTVDNDLIAIGALNTDDSKAIESMLPCDTLVLRFTDRIDRI